MRKSRSFRFYILLSISLIIISFAGCKFSPPSTSSDDESLTAALPSSFDTISDSSDEVVSLDVQAYQQYLMPAFCSGITGSAWKSAEEILPDQLVLFYSLNTLEKQYPDGWFDLLEIPEKEVEDGIQRSFDVSTKRLRQAEVYDSKQGVYIFGYGIGGGADFIPTTAYKKNGLVYIEFEYKNVDVVIRKGTIVLDVTDEECKYISCDSKEIN